MANHNGLNIYKASAGSGKTFLLVGEYLKMLFAQPYSYRNILAVTFTNKATAEMKERILKELAFLAAGGKSRYPELLETYRSENLIRERATRVLKLILHDYSRFSVMTIDSFFQKVIRSFAREIRLNASFRTEIDNRQALEDAVDLLFQEIDGNELLMKWMIQFLEDNLEEGRSWDFKQELLKFGKEVEKEAFKIHGDEFLETLSGKEKLGAYIDEIKEIVNISENRLKQLGQEGIDLIADSGMSFDQMKGGKNSFAGIFNKLMIGKFDVPTKTVTEAQDHVENWYKKTDSAQIKSQIEKLYDNGLNRLLGEAIDALAFEIPRMNGARAILKNIYPFGLLGNIALKIKEVLNENNTVLLSDSGRMIGKIIEGNDSPFIYEKVGLIYHHFMLDEFQDTSRQQWTNFRPLIENSLASGFSSLVVGDVKQSIYRWRNGDWNLLENQVASDLSHLLTSKHTLGKNWRSKSNIVDFNNSLFWRTSAMLNSWFESEIVEYSFPDLKGVITRAYEENRQECSQNGVDDGFVRLNFVDMEGDKTKNGFREKALMLLIEQLESVQQSGVKAEEMTILVRENSEAEKIANALWERKKNNPQTGCIYDVITSDTLKIGQSQVVKFVVNFFRFFTRKDPQRIRSEILYTYYCIILPVRFPTHCDTPEVLHDLFDADTPLPELFQLWLELDTQSDFLSGLLALPLYELAVAISDHFELGEIRGEKVYLQAFLDMVLEYGRDDCGGIPGFLEWWDASGCNKTLNLPNIQNFIRISSIHQSKGLEYPTVFIPFCNWEVGLNSRKLPYLWTMPESEPFNHLKLVLLKCDSTLKNSVFSYDYYREMLFSIMDNLNLLYVSMTRSINNLFVIMPWKDDLKQFTTVAELIQTLLEHQGLTDSIDREKYIDFSKHWDPDRKIFEFGTIGSLEKLEKAVGQKLQNDPLILRSNNNRMKIRLHSKDYFQLTGNRQAERINKGTVMHQIFEKIYTRRDVKTAVDLVVTSGLLTSEEGTNIINKIEKMLQESPYSEWFSDQWKVLNERDILRPAESRHRPDRVLLRDKTAIVIDYKTGEKSAKDMRQMKGYLADLIKMGFTSCKGNIWYLQKNEIVSVDLEN